MSPASAVARRVYLVGRGLVARWRDARIGIRAEAHAPCVAPAGCEDALHYEPTPWWLLDAVLRELAPGPEDTVFDIGCGKGRVLAAFARMPLRRVVGVEVDAALAECARANVRRMRGLQAPVEVRCGTAQDAEYGDGTIYFLYNPFGPATLRRVVERIHDSVVRRPRRVRIAYCNPIHGAALREFAWLDVRQRDWSPWLRRRWSVLFAEPRD